MDSSLLAYLKIAGATLGIIRRSIGRQLLVQPCSAVSEHVFSKLKALLNAQEGSLLKQEKYLWLRPTIKYPGLLFGLPLEFMHAVVTFMHVVPTRVVT